MTRKFKRADITKDLVNVATGRAYADLVIRNIQIVNVHTLEIIPNTDVAITKGHIAFIGDATHTIGENTKCVDGQNKYLAPGFIDGHIHVESSMLTLKEYTKAVVTHGTTSIMMDPHEIANVLGKEGVGIMINESREVPLNVYTTMPSCVPATTEFETSGGVLSFRDIALGLNHDNIIGLGEMMNYTGVIDGDSEVHSILKATLDRNKIITGHYPAFTDDEKGINAYISSGANCCHETTRAEDALAKMRLGMYVQIREGSAWCDAKELLKAITKTNIDSRFACLVSDDTHPDTLLSKGHMDYIVKRAIEEGVDPIRAIQMATINAAQCFGIDNEIGSISPGKCADLILIDDLYNNFTVDMTIINGEIVSTDGNLDICITTTPYPDFSKNTMHIYEPISTDDFALPCPDNFSGNIIKANVIQIIPKQAGTIHKKLSVNIHNGKVESDTPKDILKVAVIDRHSSTASKSVGLVTGFGIKEGAVASTVSHDSHNLCIMGTNDDDMAIAANTLIKVGGGQVVVKNGELLALNPLPIAGLMSDEPLEVVAKRVSQIDTAWSTIGCDIESPFMTMALIALPVIPEIRLTNKGLVNTISQKFINIFES